MKYGSEKSIWPTRSSLIVIVERIRSAVPSSRNGIRLSEIASMNFGSTPSFAATALPISMSKPSTSLVCGFWKPNGGTSNFTPIVISPFAWILPSVESAGNFSSLLGRRRGRLRAAAAGLLFVVAAAGERERGGGKRYAQKSRDLHGFPPSPSGG